VPQFRAHVRIPLAARLGVIGLAVVASGCAANKQPSYVAGPQATAQRVADLPPRKVEVEEDGRPAQVPGRRMRAEEDDPSEPWSPNYGKGVVPQAPAVSPERRLPRQVDAAMPEPAPRKVVMSTRLSEAEVEAVMARAISAHEMRRN
jgi:hypothetical protein